MQIRLHDRSEAGARSRGLSCDGDGLRLGGDHALIDAHEGPFGRVFRRRPIDQINRLLSAGYGAPVDLTPREPVLDQIADCLTKGDLPRAQLLALQLRLLDLPDEGAADRLAKAEQLIRFNPNHDDVGRFASAPGGGAGGGALMFARDPTLQVQAAAARALQARNLGPIQGEYGDPNLNALNYLANGKAVPAGLPTPDLSRYLASGAQPNSHPPKDLFPAPQTPVTLDESDAQLAETLNDHLTGTPMDGLGPRLVYWGKVNNIDPRLLVALAGAETSCGANVTIGANNYWNWLWNKPRSHSYFPTLDRAIQIVAGGLNARYNLTSLAFYDGSAKGQPISNGPYYCASGCGTKNLYSIFESLGGDPNRLGYGGTNRPQIPRGRAHE